MAKNIYILLSIGKGRPIKRAHPSITKINGSVWAFLLTGPPQPLSLIQLFYFAVLFSASGQSELLAVKANVRFDSVYFMNNV